MLDGTRACPLRPGRPRSPKWKFFLSLFERHFKGQMKKIFTACLGTETNTFASIPTGHQLFEETCLYRKASYGKNKKRKGR